MSNKSLFIGMALIVAAGAAVWFLQRPDMPLGPEPPGPEPPGWSEAPGGAPDRNGQGSPEGTGSPESTAVDAGAYARDDTARENTAREELALAADLLDPGDEAPAFELGSLLGEPFALEAYRGRLVVLNFWATWCEPCRDEMPDLMMVQDSLAGEGVVVVGISMDEEGREVVAPFHEAFPVTYPLLIDGLDVARRYGAHHVVPTTYVVDRTGRIADRFVGAVTREELLPRLRALL